MAKIHVETYGCTLNQADSDIMKGVLCASGHVLVEEKDADTIVVNTCTVKGATENKIYERLKALGSSGKAVVVAGCMAVNQKKIRDAMPGAVIVWPSAIGQIGKAVQAARRRTEAEFREQAKGDYYVRMFTEPILRVPIGEGCAGSCHFCQTRLARPVLKSYSKGTILEWIATGVRKGAKEVQLTAMDCGAYGLDRQSGLVELLEEINRMDGDFRVRLGMINPEHVKRMLDGLLPAFKGGRMYRFLHIPAQSGSEKVCREMNRKHTVADFEAIVSRFRAEMPDMSIATDIIAGYPTETEGDFTQTKEMLLRVKPDVINISKFSPRPGTIAKELPQLQNSEIKRRSSELAELARKLCDEKNQAYVGSELEVLVTERGRDFTGRAANYKQVVLPGFGGGLGEKAVVRINSANHGSLFGYALTAHPAAKNEDDAADKSKSRSDVSDTAAGQK